MAQGTAGIVSVVSNDEKVLGSANNLSQSFLQLTILFRSSINSHGIDYTLYVISLCVCSAHRQLFRAVLGHSRQQQLELLLAA